MCNVDRAAAAGDRSADFGDLNNLGVEPTVAAICCGSSPTCSRFCVHINVNLREVLAHIMRKVDLYQCPYTHACYLLSASDGSARWQPYPY